MNREKNMQKKTERSRRRSVRSRAAVLAAAAFLSLGLLRSSEVAQAVETGNTMQLTAVKNGFVTGKGSGMDGKTASEFAESTGYLRVKHSDTAGDKGEAYHRRSYIDFSLKDISEPVSKAQLELTVLKADNGYSTSTPYYVGTYDGDMDKVDVTPSFADWLQSSAPADEVEMSFDSAGTPADGTLMYADVTGQVNTAIEDGKETITFCVYHRDKDKNNGLNIYSLKATDDSKKPHLTLTLSEDTGDTDNLDGTGEEKSVIAEEDTYVQAGRDSDKPGSQLNNVNEVLRAKYSDNVNDQTYTRRIAMRFDLASLDTEGMDQFLLRFQTADSGANNPGEHFASLKIKTFEMDGWSRSTLTWNTLNTALTSTAKDVTVVTTENQVKTVQLQYPSYVYEADVTEAVEAALQAGKKNISFAFVIDTPAANNQFDIFASTSARDDQKPALVASEAPYVSGVEDVAVETLINVKPQLPQTVTAEYKTGTTGQEEVVWNNVSESDYAKIGTFQVTGTLKNYPYMTVTAHVTVTPDPSYEGTTYYISNNGDDGNDGTSPEKAWKTLDKVNEKYFLPGDKILFEAGGIWNGYLKPQGNGTEDKLITLSSYGDIDAEGRPVINGGGTEYSDYSATIMLVNQSYWTISNFELTNYGQGEEYGVTKYERPYARAGIYLYTYDQENLVKGLTVENCYVHDVVSCVLGDGVGNIAPKMSGGIIALAEWRTPDGQKAGDPNDNVAGFDGVKLQYNTVYRTMHEGIRTKVQANSGTFNRTCKNISINNNYIEDTLGDGIVLGEADGNAVVEYNVVNKAAARSLNKVYYAAAWTHFSTGVKFQYNEIYGTTYGQTDGQAFDADNECYDTLFQYNYSHDNQGGALLLMGSQRNTVYRYNISANDATGNNQEIFQDHSNNGTATGAPIVYNNTLHIAKNGRYLFSSMNTTGTPEYVTFVNNIVNVKEDVSGLQFSKSNKGIAAGSKIQNNLFTSQKNFGLYDAGWTDNYYGDAELVNPEAYVDHRDGFATGERTLASVEELKKDPLSTLREHAANYAPQNTELVEGKGIDVTTLGLTMDLTEDMMGTPLKDTAAPTLGAIEVKEEPCVHDPVFTADTANAAISASCRICREELGTAKLSVLTDPEHAGTANAVTVVYSANWDMQLLGELEVVYVDSQGNELTGPPTENGTYTAVLKAEGASVSMDFEVTEETSEQPDGNQPVTPDEGNQGDTGNTGNAGSTGNAGNDQSKPQQSAGSTPDTGDSGAMAPLFGALLVSAAAMCACFYRQKRSGRNRMGEYR